MVKIFKTDLEKLFSAIKNENIEKVKSILENSYKNKKILKLNKKDEDGWSSLYYAISINNIEIVQLLIEYANQYQFFLNLNEKDKEGNYPFLEAIKKNNIEMVQLLIEYANQNQIFLVLNEKDELNPFYWAITNNSVKIVQLLIEYANQRQIILELNEKDGLKPLYWAITNNCIEIVQLLIEYANQHQIIFELNKSNINENGYDLFLLAIFYNNVEMVQLLIEYASQHQISLKLNEKDEDGNYSLLWAIRNNNVEIVQLLMVYALQHQIILNLNEDETGNQPLSLAIYRNSVEIVQLLIQYANQHQIILELNKKDKDGRDLLFGAISKSNFEIVKLLIEYALQHQIILELNEKDKNGNYPLLEAVSKNNKEIVKLLMEIANQHQINLELNEKNKDGNYTLLEATSKNNIEIAKLLIEYANQHQFILELNEKNYRRSYPLLEAIYSSNNIEMVQLLIEYALQHRIVLTYDKNYINDIYIFNKQEIILLLEDYENQKKGKKGRLYKLYDERERLERERLERELERERSKTERLERERLIINNNDNDNILPKTPTLVIAINNFEGQRYDHLDIKKDEFLIVTNWRCGEKGYVYGHRKDNENEKGIFPEIFIKIFKDENLENTSFNKITPEYKISFENKINQLKSFNEMNIIDLNTVIEVERNNIFNDAFYDIMNKSPQELKGRLKIRYKEEEGLDAGGLLRDFFYQISKIIGDPNYSLFKYYNDDSYELEINPNSGDNNHLSYYRFIGRIIGLAIFNKQYLSVTFTLPFYKRLLNKPLEFSDLEYVDSQLFKNLQQLKNINGAEDLCLTFSMNIEDGYGNCKTIELKPNGTNIDVTDANKNEYIDLVVKNKLCNTNDIKQLNALKQGFYEIIPQRINSLLNEIDLKYLISGINTIDVDDWKNNTDYDGYEKDDITIKCFWECVKKFSDENRTKLLLFATGNSQIPVTGFKDLQGNGKIQHFKLKKTGTEKDLPVAHTCFNRIDLPPYTSYTIMKQKLLLAISEGMGAFSME